VSARARLALAAIVAGLASAALFLPLCNLVYDCGCSWFFAGGSTHCNIHNPRPPHCPLCIGNPLDGLLFTAAVFSPLWGAFYWLLSRRS